MVKLIKKIKKYIVKKHIDKLHFPAFTNDEIIRNKITFTGKVQRVGFRYEYFCIAKRIGITGYARNLQNNIVITEVQGTKAMIDELLKVIHNEKRFVIKETVIEKINVINDESDFKII